MIGLDGAGKTTFLEQVKGVCGVKRSLPLEVRAADLLVITACFTEIIHDACTSQRITPTVGLNMATMMHP